VSKDDRVMDVSKVVMEDNGKKPLTPSDLSEAGAVPEPPVGEGAAEDLETETETETSTEAEVEPEDNDNAESDENDKEIEEN
jgi:hypothetical protein